jgi:uncharacterized Zn-binding protein involved in type VI secretion
MAVREGDSLTTGHACTGITNLAISLVRTVKANGIVGAVQGTPTVGHPAPPTPICPAHVAALNKGSTNVRIGGIPWGRIGDSADAGAMISGSLNVLVNGR